VIKRISLLVTAALLAAMMMVATAAPAFASPASDACSDAGGTYDNTGNPKSCVLPPEDFTKGKPKSDNASKPFTKETTNTSTGAGGGGGEKRDSTSTTKNRGGHTV
jgi:hypothetical protein